jgi:hypothetical protein
VDNAHNHNGTTPAFTFFRHKQKNSMKTLVILLGIAALAITGCESVRKTDNSTYRTAPAFQPNSSSNPDMPPNAALPAGQDTPPANALPAPPANSGRNPPLP